MSSRKIILREHYLNLVRSALSWLGAAAVIVSVFLPMSAQAAVGQLEPRKTAVSTSAPSATGVTYTFTFNPSATNSGTNIKAIGLQVCNSPIDGVTCNQASASDLSSATFSAGSSSAPFTSGWAVGTGSDCGTHTTTYVCIYNGSGNALNSSTSYSIVITGVKNPTSANLEYYTRITTYTAAAAGTPSGETDFGGEAVSTGQSLNTTALVQESLIFSVGQTGSCGSLSGTSVYIGGSSLSTAILSSSAAEAGTSVLCINTNASNGYQLSYLSSQGTGGGTCPNSSFTNCTGTAHDFHDTSSASTFSSQISGTQDFFGINIRNNVGANGDIASGADPTSGAGIVAPTYDSGYGSQDQFAFSHAAVTPLAHETTGPTSTIQYTASYEAQAAPNTPSGQYEVNMDYICTSSY